MDKLCEGQYALRILGTKFGKNQKGTIEIQVWLRDPEDPNSGIDDFIYPLTKKGEENKFATRRLKAYGFPDDAAFDSLNIDGSGNPLEGKTVDPVTIVSELYDGKTKYKVAAVNDEVQGGFMERMDPTEAAVLAAELAAKLGRRPAVVRRKPAPKPAPVAAPVAQATGTDDDVPF